LGAFVFNVAELVLFSGPPACVEAPVTARVFRVEDSGDRKTYEVLLGGRLRGSVVKAAEFELSKRVSR
jgi:hypothetical protein